ncbi:MAG: hypothetical protein ACYC99_16575, partial [Candidatus Geothermincolia bacterium]
ERLPAGPAGAGKNLLLGEAFSPYWKLNGNEPEKNLETTTSFPVKDVVGAIRVEYNNPWLLTGYALSGAGLLLCIVLTATGAMRDRKRLAASRNADAGKANDPS